MAEGTYAKYIVKDEVQLLPPPPEKKTAPKKATRKT
jgi:hypothetical protein